MDDIAIPDSHISKSADDFKKKVLNNPSIEAGFSSALPSTYDVHLASDVDLKQLQLFAARLKDNKEPYKALFIFR